MIIILTSLAIGLLSIASPCVMPLYSGFLAYIAGGHEQLENKIGRASMTWHPTGPCFASFLGGCTIRSLVGSTPMGKIFIGWINRP